MYQDEFEKIKNGPVQKKSVQVFDFQICSVDDELRNASESEISDSKFPNLPFDVIGMGEILVVKGDKKQRNRASTFVRQRHYRLRYGRQLGYKMTSRNIEKENTLLIKKVPNVN